MGYGTVVLAGHHEGTANLIREYADKTFSTITYSLLSDAFIFGLNKSLLPLHPDIPLEKRVNLMRLVASALKSASHIKRGRVTYNCDANGTTLIEQLVSQVTQAQSLDAGYTVAVGPKPDLEKVLGSLCHVQEQGRSLAENISRGARWLYSSGYKEDYFYVLCSDLSALSHAAIDQFIGSCSSRGVDVSLFAGFGTREELGSFLREKRLLRFGRLGINYVPFIPGRVNKFGLPLRDDAGLVTDAPEAYHFMSGNMFLARRDLADREQLAEWLYSMKRFFLNPANWRFFRKSLDYQVMERIFGKNRLGVLEAEGLASRIIARETGVKGFSLKFAYVPPEGVLDVDTWKDLYRNSHYLQSLERTSSNKQN